MRIEAVTIGLILVLIWAVVEVLHEFAVARKGRWAVGMSSAQIIAGIESCEHKFRILGHDKWHQSPKNIPRAALSKSSSCVGCQEIGEGVA
jgi:hypothetical protein